MTLDAVTKFVPLVAGLLYAVVGIAYFMKKEWAWGVVWTSYSFANFGLTIAGNE